MSTTYRNRRRDAQLRRCAAMRAAKERKRLSDNPGEWRRAFALPVVGHASPDGRTLAIQAHNCETWQRCGSERAVRGALAKLMWNRKQPPVTGELPTTSRAVACRDATPSTDGGSTLK